MKTYKSELIKSMEYLSKFKNTLFIGQSVNYSGNAIYNYNNQMNNRLGICEQRLYSSHYF